MLQMESVMNSLISRDPQKMGMHKKKGMQIMFSLTPNSTQDPPGTLWEDISCLFLI
jgi:hypothetical protein